VTININKDIFNFLSFDIQEFKNYKQYTLLRSIINNEFFKCLICFQVFKISEIFKILVILLLTKTSKNQTLILRYLLY